MFCYYEFQGLAKLNPWTSSGKSQLFRPTLYMYMSYWISFRSVDVHLIFSPREEMSRKWVTVESLIFLLFTNKSGKRVLFCASFLSFSVSRCFHIGWESGYPWKRSHTSVFITYISSILLHTKPIFVELTLRHRLGRYSSLWIGTSLNMDTS